MMQVNPRSTTSTSVPQPGEIWELSRSLRAPLPLDAALYSEPAQRFLAGQPPNRYVMIVHEPEAIGPFEAEWQTVLVMILTEDTRFHSPVDPIISIQNSGRAQAVLVETWHVVLMLVCNLEKPTRHRLSRELYDHLLDLGDRAFTGSPDVLAFHQQEQAWSDVLSVPLAAYYAARKRFQMTEHILEAAVQLEQEMALPLQLPISLRQWLEQQFEAQWQAIDNRTPSLAIASRSHEPDNPEEIATLIHTLLNSDSSQQQQAARRLGQTAGGRADMIAALVTVLQHTQDDETLWTVAEALWNLDPDHSAAGVRRVRRIDWGMRVPGQAVALVVAIVQKSNQQISVFLQVCPSDTGQYLPPDLKLILIDDTGQVQRELTARRSDVCLQLKLSGAPNERFSVCIQLGTASIIEEFIL
ncbi:DUF1822 family protein [Cyanobacteria bacterium FACHB-63]|nr:DUF1822 family protein [Cyanobacteria bacterium FACHB-63]